MDIQRKEQRLSEALHSLTRHDDEPLEQIEAAIQRVFVHATDELAAARQRRADAKAAAEVEQQRKAADEAARASATAGDTQPAVGDAAQ